VLGVNSTGTAVLADGQLFWGIGFVALGDVVEITAFGAFQSHVLSWTFFCHFLVVFS